MQTGQENYSIYVAAADPNQLNSLVTLITNDPSQLNVKNTSGETPLAAALLARNPSAIFALVSAGADLTISYNDQTTRTETLPFFEAINLFLSKGREDILNAFLKGITQATPQAMSLQAKIASDMLLIGRAIKKIALYTLLCDAEEPQFNLFQYITISKINELAEEEGLNALSIRNDFLLQAVKVFEQSLNEFSSLLFSDTTENSVFNQFDEIIKVTRELLEQELNIKIETLGKPSLNEMIVGLPQLNSKPEEDNDDVPNESFNPDIFTDRAKRNPNLCKAPIPLKRRHFFPDKRRGFSRESVDYFDSYFLSSEQLIETAAILLSDDNRELLQIKLNSIYESALLAKRDEVASEIQQILFDIYNHPDAPDCHKKYIYALLYRINCTTVDSLYNVENYMANEIYNMVYTFSARKSAKNYAGATKIDSLTSVCSEPPLSLFNEQELFELKEQYSYYISKMTELATLNRSCNTIAINRQSKRFRGNLEKSYSNADALLQALQRVRIEKVQTMHAELESEINALNLVNPIITDILTNFIETQLYLNTKKAQFAPYTQNQNLKTAIHETKTAALMSVISLIQINYIRTINQLQRSQGTSLQRPRASETLSYNGQFVTSTSTLKDLADVNELVPYLKGYCKEVKTLLFSSKNNPLTNQFPNNKVKLRLNVLLRSFEQLKDNVALQSQQPKHYIKVLVYTALCRYSLGVSAKEPHDELSDIKANYQLADYEDLVAAISNELYQQGLAAEEKANENLQKFYYQLAIPFYELLLLENIEAYEKQPPTQQQISTSPELENDVNTHQWTSLLLMYGQLSGIMVNKIFFANKAKSLLELLPRVGFNEGLMGSLTTFIETCNQQASKQFKH